MGIPILGKGSDALSAIARLDRERTPVTEIVIAMPASTAPQRRAVIANCRAAGVPFRTLPGMSELLSGPMRVQVREVSANDLLGREPVRIDETRIERSVAVSPSWSPAVAAPSGPSYAGSWPGSARENW